MENKKSLLNADKVYATNNIYINIPTVGQILEDEETYYNIITSLTAVPYQYMVQLDDIGIDYTVVTEYELFLMLFPNFRETDLSLIFGDLNTSDYKVKYDNSNSTNILYSEINGYDYKIDEFTYYQIVSMIRKINNLEKFKGKPGNEEAKHYLLEQERKKQKRNARKKYEPYLEKLVIALVNTNDFPYDYDSCMDLSIYRFNQSFKQIQQRITFDNTMIGIYAGTVDTSKMKDKSCLSWIQTK